MSWFVDRHRLLGAVQLAQVARVEDVAPDRDVGSDVGRVGGDGPLVDRERLQCHRAVDEDGHPGDPSRVRESTQGHQHDLGAVHGERGDQDHAPSVKGAIDDVGELVVGGWWVVTVAVRRLDDDDVRVRPRRWRHEQRMLASAEVAAEHHPSSRDLDQGGRRAEDVPRRVQREEHLVGDLRAFTEGKRSEHREQALDVVEVVEGPRRRVLGEALRADVGGVLLLQLGAVPQHDLGQRDRRLRREDGRLQALVHQGRQVSGVVEMGVADDDRVEVAYVEGQRVPVAAPELTQPLEEPGLDEQLGPVAAQVELAAGHRPGAPQELQCRPHTRW